MSSEIQIPGPGTGKTIYAVVRDGTGRVWSTSGGTGGFETFSSGNWTEYVLQATEQGVNNYYAATMPTAMPAGVYNISAHQQLTGTAAQTDPRIAAGEEQWNGAALFPMSDLATSGQLGQIGPIKLTKGMMVQNFAFYLKSAADHITPFVSGIVSGQISRNGGSFGPLQSGAFTEMGLGFYKVDLTSGDLNGQTVALMFTANGTSGMGTSDPLPLAFVMQKASGSV